MNLWLIPASDDDALANIFKTLAAPISTERTEKAGISSNRRAWGAKVAKGSNINKFKKMAPGDWCLFYTQARGGGAKKYYWKARIEETIRNASIAEALWDDPVFELVYFLKDVEEIAITTEVLSSGFAEFRSSYYKGAPRGFAPVDPHVTTSILSKFHSIEAWLNKLSNKASGPFEHAKTVSMSATAFHAQFLCFKAAVLKRSGKEFQSFLHGLPYEWGYYKTPVHHEGLRRLNYLGWTSSDIGSGKILKAVIQAVEINEGDDLRNNLLFWNGSHGGSRSRSHRSLYFAQQDKRRMRAYEAALFDFFNSISEDEGAMDALIEQAGKHYDFLAYLFFLKDWERFLPVLPATFDKALEALCISQNGKPLRLTGKFSWANYNAFNDAMRLVQAALKGEGIADVRLIDAHSFCLMLIELEPDGLQPNPNPIPMPELLAFRGAASSAEIVGLEPRGSTRSVDFDAWQANRRHVGEMAEELVFAAERERLCRANRRDLAEKVKLTSSEHALGFDIQSWNADGSPRPIEVKSVRNQSDAFSFYLTENEWQKSRTLPGYHFYFVFGVCSERPIIRFMPACAVNRECLRPIVHVVALNL